MFSQLFGNARQSLRSARKSRRATVDSLYGQIVAAARQPTFYADWNVPDTPLGRFEMLSLHHFLFLHATRGATGADAAGLREIAQELTDALFQDVEHSLRELGIGDMGVPKRMKKLARMFYGRAASYGATIDAGDREALAEALSRNIRPDAGAWPQASSLAAYAMRAYEDLRAAGISPILRGAIAFPDAADCLGEGIQ